MHYLFLLILELIQLLLLFFDMMLVKMDELIELPIEIVLFSANLQSMFTFYTA